MANKIKTTVSERRNGSKRIFTIKHVFDGKTIGTQKIVIG